MININIKSTNFNMTPDIKTMIEDKINLLEKFIDLGKEETALAEVEMERSSRHKKGEVFRAEINLSFKGKIYRASETHYDPRNAIEKAKNEIEKEIRRTKGKKDSLFKRGARKIKNLITGKNE